MSFFKSPLGARVDFHGAASPGRAPLEGSQVLLRALAPEQDAGPLYRLTHPPSGDPGIWRYLPYGPYPNEASFGAALSEQAGSQDPLFFAVVPRAAGAAQGLVAYQRIVPEHGCIEIAHVWFGPPLQRTAAASECIYLLARRAFDELGYRRVEWKCDSLNGPSRRAAERFGFVFEGIFAQHMVIKGHNRDTAWYAITDRRWPQVRAAFEAWLAPENFGAAGGQRRSLGSLMPAVRPPRA